MKANLASEWTVKVSGKQLESEMIPTECNFEADLVPIMTNLTPSISSEPASGPPCSNGIVYKSSSPKVEDGSPAIKRGRRLDIELQELFAESRAGKIWRAAAHLSPADVHILTERAVYRLTDCGDRAFLSTSSRPARRLLNIPAKKRPSGLAVSSRAVCTLC
jgi:hypothetical protein